MAKYLLVATLILAACGCSSEGTSPTDEQALKQKLEAPVKPPNAGGPPPMKGANPKAPH